MSTPSFTPGPWVLDKRHPGYIYCDDALGSAVATCRGVGLEFSDVAHRDYAANANLIAAAPDLYAACKDLLADLRELQALGFKVDDSACGRAVSAIAKAEGRQP